MVCAPTGTAAKNINGKTLHSALHLPVQHGNQPELTQLSSKSLKKTQIRIASKHTLIIDEISMVSSNMLEFIHRRLCSIKDTDVLFGGMNIIAVGDFFQLRPVRGYFAFENNLLWSEFKPFFLQLNVRQSGDNNFAALLNRARVGLLTNENITLLNSRVVPVKNSDLASTIHLYPTLKQVKKHNDKIQALITECSVEQVEAKHCFSPYDMNPNNVVDDEFIPEDDRNAGGLAQNFKFSVGTRVMLIRNIYTSKGLVNGALGYIVKFEKYNNEILEIYVNLMTII